MVIDMDDEQLRTLADVQGFLDGTMALEFAVAADERYAFIARTVKRFGYGRLKRSDKAVVLRFLERVSGYSRQQIARLVKRGGERRPLVKRYRGSRTSFARTYTVADVLLLAQTDTLHGTLSGLATKKLMERAYGVFSDVRYQRLATISVAHLYNLRQQPKYQQQRQVWTKTRPSGIPIGERRAPAPNNRPGYLRVDSVHQGDQDGMKGVYHINAVDCVTQYEGVAKGRQRKRYPYRLMMTPYEKLKSLSQAETFLKPKITFAQLDALAGAMSDNAAAERMNAARSALFRTIFKETPVIRGAHLHDRYIVP